MDRNASAKKIATELLGTGRRIEILSFLDGGWSNRNYKMNVEGELMVLRIATTRSPAVDHELRFFALSCSPDLVAADRSHGHVITRWVDGCHLYERPPTPSEAAAYLRHLHATVPTDIRTYDPREVIARMFHGANAENSAMFRVFSALHWQPHSAVGCHNDLNPYNIIRTADGYCTLDWESAGTNDPYFDLAGLTLGLRWSDAEVLACAAAYFGSELDLKRLVRTRVLYQLKEHSWALEKIATTNARAEIHEQATTSRAEINRLSALMT